MASCCLHNYLLCDTQSQAVYMADDECFSATSSQAVVTSLARQGSNSKLTKSVTRCASTSTVKVHLMDKKVAHWSCEVETEGYLVNRTQGH